MEIKKAQSTEPLGTRISRWLKLAWSFVTRFVSGLASHCLLYLSVFFFFLAFMATWYWAKDQQNNAHMLQVAPTLAAMAGILLTLQKLMGDRRETTSRFYLDEYRKGYDTAFEILDSAAVGDPLLRMKWIAAARLLLTSQSLYHRIRVSAHRTVAQMDIPFQSQRFHRFFEMPHYYYYGVQEQGLTEAATASTAGTGAAVNKIRHIPERVIRAVFAAVQYPKNYREVLGHSFNEGERLFLPEGLRDYLSHKDHWHSAAGKLFERKPGEKAE